MPGDEWISQNDVVNAIADAMHPDRRRAKGADLITRKVLQAAPVKGLEALLSEPEKKLLKELPGASKLRPDSSDEEWERLVRAFRHRHPKKARLWTPARPTAMSLYADYAARGHIIGPHLQQLREWVAAEKIVARDAVNASTTRLEAHTELLGTCVQKYLRTVGLRFVVGNASPPPLYPHGDPPRPQARARRGEPTKWKGGLLDRLKELASETPRLTNKQIAQALGEESAAQIGKIRRQIESETTARRVRKLSSSNPFGIKAGRESAGDDD